MSPESLAKANTESGHQKALFAWANMARLYGFEVANNPEAYSLDYRKANYSGKPVECLRWLHAIPNGGARDAVTAARMKAEGVKAGVYDVFLPVPRYAGTQREPIEQHGLYIELKKIGKLSNVSDEQISFAAHCVKHGYGNFVCEGWRDAADCIQRYLGA